MSEVDINEYCYSGSARKEIADILHTHEDMDSADVKATIRDLEQAIWFAVTIDVPESPGATKKELEILRVAIVGLIGAIKGLSHHGKFAMQHATWGLSRDDELAKFDAEGKLGSEVVDLWKHARFVDKAASLALETIKVPLGAPPNLVARHLAFHVFNFLYERGVECTTYEDGTYFKILHIVFADVLPEVGKEAYRRHATWALSGPTLEETFVKTV